MIICQLRIPASRPVSLLNTTILRSMVRWYTTILWSMVYNQEQANQQDHISSKGRGRNLPASRVECDDDLRLAGGAVHASDASHFVGVDAGGSVLPRRSRGKVSHSLTLRCERGLPTEEASQRNGTRNIALKRTVERKRMSQDRVVASTKDEQLVHVNFSRNFSSNIQSIAFIPIFFLGVNTKRSQNNGWTYHGLWLRR
jgi:hypothetical protein